MNLKQLEIAMVACTVIGCRTFPEDFLIVEGTVVLSREENAEQVDLGGIKVTIDRSSGCKLCVTEYYEPVAIVRTNEDGNFYVEILDEDRNFAVGVSMADDPCFYGSEPRVDRRDFKDGRIRIEVNAGLRATEGCREYAQSDHKDQVIAPTN